MVVYRAAAPHSECGFYGDDGGEHDAGVVCRAGCDFAGELLCAAAGAVGICVKAG